jgi:dolichol-phosphate mannosyltransferase
MVKFALDVITAFSFVPLQAATYLGLVISGFSFLYIVHVVMFRLFTDQTVPGWTGVVSILHPLLCRQSDRLAQRA